MGTQPGDYSKGLWALSHHPGEDSIGLWAPSLGEDIKRLWEYFNHALGLALLRYGIVLSCFLFILNFVLFSCCRVKGGGGVEGPLSGLAALMKQQLLL